MPSLEKRTYDARPYDIICTQLLPPGATIAQVNQILCDPSSAGLVFGSPIINVQQVIYQDGTIAPPGAVIQVHISGGAIPPNTAGVMCTIRAQFTDSNGDNTEATVLLNLTDKITQ